MGARQSRASAVMLNAAHAALRKTDAQAVQVGNTRVTQTGSITSHDTSTPRPSSGNLTFEYFVQCAATNFEFDSFHVYIETKKGCNHSDHALLSGCYYAAEAMYGTWASQGVIVHVHAVHMENGRRRRVANASFTVLKGTIRTWKKGINMGKKGRTFPGIPGNLST